MWQNRTPVNFRLILKTANLKLCSLIYANYAGGQGEIDLGLALRSQKGLKRSDFVLSTKVFWGGKGPNDRGLSRKHIFEGLMASLQRLQLDYVDIVYAQRPGEA